MNSVILLHTTLVYHSKAVQATQGSCSYTRHMPILSSSVVPVSCPGPKATLIRKGVAQVSTRQLPSSSSSFRSHRELPQCSRLQIPASLLPGCNREIQSSKVSARIHFTTIRKKRLVDLLEIYFSILCGFFFFFFFGPFLFFLFGRKTSEFCTEFLVIREIIVCSIIIHIRESKKSILLEYLDQSFEIDMIE